MSSHEALAAAVDLARAAAQVEAGDEPVGGHVGTHTEDDTALTHLFEAGKPGYSGWRWAVTVACAGTDDVTVSEVVLLPGPEALTAPAWVPWQERVQAGDLGVGDLMPTAPDDPRLVPGYVWSDDPAVEEVAREIGLGRERVLSREGRLDAARRWHDGEYGPRSDMARSAPAHCGTCGFFVPVAGSLRAAFGVCGNDIAPADGRVVHAEYGCGAHSEAEVEQVSPVLVADLIYDDAELDIVAAVATDAPAPLEAEAVDVPPVTEPRAAQAATDVPEAAAEMLTGSSAPPEATAAGAEQSSVQAEDAVPADRNEDAGHAPSSVGASASEPDDESMPVGVAGSTSQAATEQAGDSPEAAAPTPTAASEDAPAAAEGNELPEAAPQAGTEVAGDSISTAGTVAPTAGGEGASEASGQSEPSGLVSTAPQAGVEGPDDGASETTLTGAPASIEGDESPQAAPRADAGVADDSTAETGAAASEGAPVASGVLESGGLVGTAPQAGVEGADGSASETTVATKGDKSAEPAPQAGAGVAGDTVGSGAVVPAAAGEGASEVSGESESGGLVGTAPQAGTDSADGSAFEATVTGAPASIEGDESPETAPQVGTEVASDSISTTGTVAPAAAGEGAPEVSGELEPSGLVGTAPQVGVEGADDSAFEITVATKGDESADPAPQEGAEVAGDSTSTAGASGEPEFGGLVGTAPQAGVEAAGDSGNADATTNADDVARDE